MTEPASDPFDEAFLRRLALLRVVVDRARVSGASGEHTGRDRGGRVEFQDHRRYAPGDELRTVDWHVYARLEKLFVKEFAREQEVHLRLVLDASASMGLPGKWNAARRLAAALLWVGLASGHEVRPVVVGERGVLRGEPTRGEAAFPGVLDRLRVVTAGGATTPAEAVAERAGRGGRNVLVLLSDLYEREVTRRALRSAAERGCEVSLVHWLSRDELEPSFRGASRLRDAESGEVLPLALGEPERVAYAARLEAFCADWRRFAGAHGLRYVLAASDRPLEQQVLETLRRGGLLR